MAGFELGRQHLFRKARKTSPSFVIQWSCWPVHPAWSAPPAPSGCASDRLESLPDAFRARRPAIAAGHLRGHTAFVEKHQTGGIDLAYQFPPRLPPPEVLGGFLLLRAERFFYGVIPAAAARSRAGFVVAARPRSNPAAGAPPTATVAALAGSLGPADRAAFAAAVPCTRSATAGRGSSYCTPTHAKLPRQLPQHPLARFMSLQELAPQIIRVRLRH